MLYFFVVVAIAVEAIQPIFGGNISPHVQSRITSYLAPLTLQGSTYNSITLALGNTSYSQQYIGSKLSTLSEEGYIITTVPYPSAKDLIVIADGNKLTAPSNYSLGAMYAAYDVLERIGFAFLHPLAPVSPSSKTFAYRVSQIPVNQTYVEERYWRWRGWHVHTEHPLELLSLLQGVDFHHRGITTDWQSMLPEADTFFEWCLANKVNHVEWVLLESKTFDPASEQRQQRLRTLIQLANNYGLLVGADVPIAEKQQHAWYMVDTHKPEEEQFAQIRNRTDWLIQTGFNYIATESGLSEFTHPNDTLMLDLMNYLANYSYNTYGARTYIKCHCSTGQICRDYVDPRTGEPLNFNFLPMYATDNLGIMPHTVQAYAFEDPAPVYGNVNFEYMKDFMFYEAQISDKENVYHPETNYWVNVDIDVPLFLPIYGFRRLHDYRDIAQEEISEAVKLTGTNDFDSGWEWSAWVQDVVTARSAWNPLTSQTDEDLAFKMALAPIARVFDDGSGGGSALGDAWSDLIDRIANSQLDIFILGKVNGVPPPDITKLSGIAYLCGFDAWADVERLLNINLTQPNKIKWDEHDDPLYPYVLPLLSEMSSMLNGYYNEMVQLANTYSIPQQARSLYDDMVDTIHMTCLRANEVYALYDATAPNVNSTYRQKRLNDALSFINNATTIVAKREKAYRVPWQRVGGWELNPTVYSFGYLWTVHSLYYFWRDYGQILGGSEIAAKSPCYLNIMDGTEIAFGVAGGISEIIRLLMEYFGPDNAYLIADCLAPPVREYVFPADL